MKRIAVAAIALTATAPALGQKTVPFAEPPTRQPGQLEPSLLPSLGDIMVDIQLRHIKLWYAGRARNWDLANYELDRIAENLTKAAILYMNIPIDYVSAMNKPIVDMRDATAAKDSERFGRAFSAFTAACNSCHMAGRVGFIRIQTPTSSSFSDEVYESGK